MKPLDYFNPVQELRRRTEALRLQELKKEEERMKEQRENEVTFLTIMVGIGLTNT